MKPHWIFLYSESTSNSVRLWHWKATSFSSLSDGCFISADRRPKPHTSSWTSWTILTCFRISAKLIFYLNLRINLTSYCSEVKYSDIRVKPGIFT